MPKVQMNGRRVAIIGGLRTPFAKQGTAYKNVTALQLAQLVSAELLQQLDLDPAIIEASRLWSGDAIGWCT